MLNTTIPCTVEQDIEVAVFLEDCLDILSLGDIQSVYLNVWVLLLQLLQFFKVEVSAYNFGPFLRAFLWVQVCSVISPRVCVQRGHSPEPWLFQCPELLQ